MEEGVDVDVDVDVEAKEVYQKLVCPVPKTSDSRFRLS